MLATGEEESSKYIFFQCIQVLNEEMSRVFHLQFTFI